MSKLVLAIGGPADGKIMSVGDQQDVVVVPVTSMDLKHVLAKPKASPSYKFEKVEYHVHQVVCSGLWFWIMTPFPTVDPDDLDGIWRMIKAKGHSPTGFVKKYELLYQPEKHVYVTADGQEIPVELIENSPVPLLSSGHATGWEPKNPEVDNLDQLFTLDSINQKFLDMTVPTEMLKTHTQKLVDGLNDVTVSLNGMVGSTNTAAAAFQSFTQNSVTQHEVHKKMIESMADKMEDEILNAKLGPLTKAVDLGMSDPVNNPDPYWADQDPGGIKLVVDTALGPDSTKVVVVQDGQVKQVFDLKESDDGK